MTAKTPGVQSDSERQRDDRGGREPRLLADDAKGVSQILEDGCRHDPSYDSGAAEVRPTAHRPNTSGPSPVRRWSRAIQR